MSGKDVSKYKPVVYAIVILLPRKDYFQVFNTHGSGHEIAGVIDAVGKGIATSIDTGEWRKDRE